MTDKNKRIEDILNSINGMQRVQADPQMHDKVMERLHNHTDSHTDKIRALMPGIAAAAVLLLIINTASVVHLSKKRSATQAPEVSQIIQNEMSELNNF